MLVSEIDGAGAFGRLPKALAKDNRATQHHNRQNAEHIFVWIVELNKVISAKKIGPSAEFARDPVDFGASIACVIALARLTAK